MDFDAIFIETAPEKRKKLIFPKVHSSLLEVSYIFAAAQILKFSPVVM